MWDAIVIGSGIGGLTAAAALGKQGRRVLLLEQHALAGGLTQTFRRHDWEFAPGVHYIGGVGESPGEAGEFGRLLGWLSDGELRFAPLANPYDLVRLPGFEFGVAHPQSAYREALLARFPGHEAEIAHWFEACAAARNGAFTLFAMHGMPRWLAFGLWMLRGEQADYWSSRTLGRELALVTDPRLRAVLGARWADHGAPPAHAPFVEHALVTGSYDDGAYYPIGGPARFAQTILPAVLAAGGELRTGADVRRILVEDGHARGVVYANGRAETTERARYIVSATGVANTVACLGDGVADRWRAEVGALAPGLSYLSLYLGLDGDIAAAGASSANVWIYEDEAAVGRVWRKPAEEDAPGLFVSFPSLKDPACAGAPTAEVMGIVEAGDFARWLAPAGGATRVRDEEYRALKARIEARLLAQFRRHFPALAPMVRFHELATPVTQRRFVRSAGGAMYGVEMSAERLGSPALHVKSPVPGLLLAGQDVASPGVAGAFMGGLMAAASLEPAIWRRFAG